MAIPPSSAGYQNKIYQEGLAREERSHFYDALRYSRTELCYLKELIDLPLDSLLDEGEGERLCKALGQKIFDVFKATTGRSETGEKALKDLFKALPKVCNDSRVRCLHLRYAWTGVGDSSYRWGDEWKEFED